MKRRATNRRKAAAPPPRDGAMALVRVDGRRIRREIKADYERVVRDLAKAREEFGRFQQKDLPQFSRWVNSQFGALLTELRETSQKIQQCDMRLAQMEMEVIFLGVSPGRAYQRVMNREREESTEEEQSSNNSSRDSRDRHEDAPFGNDFSGERQDFRQPRRAQSKPKKIGARLKELYRALVRRLHPDMNTEVGRKQLDWWHQAQEAYQKGDEEQLEVILTLCEIEEAGHTEKASLSVLQRITAQFKKTLRQIRRQLEQSRQEPAWRFSTRKDLAVLAASMKRQLTGELEIMRDELSALEEQLTAWAQQARRVRRPVYRRRRSAEPFF
jgi:hypothetical protein